MLFEWSDIMSDQSDGWTFAKNGQKMSDVRPLFQALV